MTRIYRILPLLGHWTGVKSSASRTRLLRESRISIKSQMWSSHRNKGDPRFLGRGGGRARPVHAPVLVLALDSGGLRLLKLDHIKLVSDHSRSVLSRWRPPGEHLHPILPRRRTLVVEIAQLPWIMAQHYVRIGSIQAVTVLDRFCRSSRVLRYLSLDQLPRVVLIQVSFLQERPLWERSLWKRRTLRKNEYVRKRRRSRRRRDLVLGGHHGFTHLDNELHDIVSVFLSSCFALQPYLTNCNDVRLSFSSCRIVYPPRPYPFSWINYSLYQPL